MDFDQEKTIRYGNRKVSMKRFALLSSRINKEKGEMPRQILPLIPRGAIQIDDPAFVFHVDTRWASFLRKTSGLRWNLKY